MLYSSLLALFAGLLFEKGQAATASFSKDNSGAEGFVTVKDRMLQINLDFGSVDVSKLPGTTNCFAAGIKYHIHDKWTYSDSDDRINSTACGISYTGGHWDPYLACGPKTGNEYCDTYVPAPGVVSTVDKCVDSSSAYTSTGVYSCNSSIYDVNPYACEVGDWSGKYGILYLDGNQTTLNVSSFWEVYGEDLIGKSIVIHCANTEARALCAPFVADGTEIHSHNLNETGETASDNVLVATFQPIDGSIPSSFTGFFKSGSYVTTFNASAYNISCDSLIYRIYDDWDSDELTYQSDSECRAVVGKVWDPTVSCLYGSDSEFCDSSFQLCNDSTYAYSCNYTNDRYSCAPGDLSGKYGNFDVSASFISLNGTDDLMPPFNLIEGKSIVVECADYSTIIACGQIVSNTSLIAYNTTMATTEPATTEPATTEPATTEPETTELATTAAATTAATTATTAATTATTTMAATTASTTDNMSAGCFYHFSLLTIAALMLFQFVF